METSKEKGIERKGRTAALEDIFGGVIQQLESCSGVCEVKLCSRAPVSPQALQEWHRRNYPYVLPADYKTILQISDGILVTWNVKLQDKIIPVGHLHISSIERIESIQDPPCTDKVTPVSKDAKITSVNNLVHQKNDKSKEDNGMENFNEPIKEKQWQLPGAIYECLDSKGFGKVAFVYSAQAAKYDDPEVWFQDVSGAWHFLASNFMCYFRLMMAHLGIFGWQYAFTDIGLPQATQFWLSYYVPERARMYRQRRAKSSRLRNIEGELRSKQRTMFFVNKVNELLTNESKKINFARPLTSASSDKSNAPMAANARRVSSAPLKR